MKPVSIRVNNDVDNDCTVRSSLSATSYLLQRRLIWILLHTLSTGYLFFILYNTIFTCFVMNRSDVYMRNPVKIVSVLGKLLYCEMFQNPILKKYPNTIKKFQFEIKVGDVIPLRLLGSLPNLSNLT